MAVGGLHQAFQYPSQVLRALVRRPLQGADGGRQRQRLSANRLRLRSPESGTGQVVAGKGRAQKFPMEQLRSVSEATRAASGLAAGGPSAGGETNTRGQRGRTGGICPAD